MFHASQYPTRLMVSCPVCRSTACIDKAELDRMQLFCGRDGVPLTVVSVAVGVPQKHQPTIGSGDLIIVRKPKPDCHPSACAHDVAFGGGAVSVGVFSFAPASFS